MQLPLQNFNALLQTMAAGVQGAASALLDLTVGSTLRAILEANAAIGLWMQWLIVQVLGVTRAATSQGADLDSWVNDYALTRLPAAAAAGTVSFTRFTPTIAAFVPVAAAVRTADGSQLFSVTGSTINPAWNPLLGGYLIAAGVASITVPVAATVPGAAGNIQPGTATVLSTAIAGVDGVTNAAAFTGGQDAESDAALRARFANYIGSLSRGTALAVTAAIQGVRSGLTFVIGENMDVAGNTVPGSFLITLDDGTGMPSAGLLASVSAAVDAVRPVGSVFAVRPPGISIAVVSMLLGVTAEPARPAAIAAVIAAVTNYIDTLPVGAALAWSRIAQVAYDASPIVTNVTEVLLNGSNLDLAVAPFAVAKAGLVTAS